MEMLVECASEPLPSAREARADTADGDLQPLRHEPVRHALHIGEYDNVPVARR